MNFRLNKIKGTWSLIVALIIGVLVKLFSKSFAICVGAPCSVEQISSMTWKFSIWGFVISLILIYVLWSLFEKR